MYSNFKVLMFLMIVLSASYATAQSNNILNASNPSDIGKLTKAQELNEDHKPLEYGYISETDILWSKIVWEKIDLNQKVNFPLLYPTQDDVFSSNRRSLFKVLLDAIKKGAEDSTAVDGITQVYSTSYFNKKKSYDDIVSTTKSVFLPDVALDILGQYGITGTDNVQTFINRSLSGSLSSHPDQYPSDLVRQMEPYLIPTEITSAGILEYHIKGMWYFDKVQGEMKYRLLGIAPAGYDIQSQNQSFSGEPQIVPYFWVWYPDARQALVKAQVLNNKNHSKSFSFDHLLNSRRFDGMIFKTQNVYQDREVKDYIQDNALLQLLESNRIKEEIRNFELDMWDY